MYKTKIFDLDKWISDFREDMYHGIVNDSNLIYEVNDGKIKGELAVPGFKKDEISIRAHPKYLDISGKMEEPRYRRVRSSFHRKITFPQRINPDTVKITLGTGMLTFEVSLEEGKEVKIIDF
jgi:HSP20 family molecular chaperone IbpA